MYITFPNACDSGPTLLLARKTVLEWSQRRKCPYKEDFNDGIYSIKFLDDHLYTLFLLEWELPPAYIVT